MKFGKVLQQSIELSSNEWEKSWVNYKQLKRIIKDCAQVSKHDKLKKEKLAASKLQNGDNDTIRTDTRHASRMKHDGFSHLGQSPDELNFFRTLRAEMAKIAELFVKEQARYSTCVTDAEAQFDQLKVRSSPLAHPRHRPAQTDADPTQAKKTKVMGTCVALFKEMLLLENFALINYCGISKALKKHDKWTGYNTRSKFVDSVLNKQSFATYSLLLSMINRVEQIFMKATGSTIAQHDTTADVKLNRAVEVQCGYSMLQLSAEETKAAESSASATATSAAASSSLVLKRQVSLRDLSAMREESFRFKRTEENLSPINSSHSNSDDDAAYDGGCEEDPSPRTNDTRPTKRQRDESPPTRAAAAPPPSMPSPPSHAGSKKMSVSTLLN
ncbi:Aste57867_21452 [Aphanomyces stellatus]|uniref:Aste57867_21452 protein n=1 Tax=Aphanomyces stellatus TaxID=120398 RepID=A0A485LME2_9STRA|nr:hypothetical protein As57867_021383 [Aphanomyces stellatus]VFT98123.1 Aste57867_21452 [Aphanomyces stellatus]